MSALMVLVDYDNVERNLKSAGPVSLAKVLVPKLDSSLVCRHNAIVVRLYGGWRAGGNLTNAAQRLIPDIRSASPTYVNIVTGGSTLSLRLTVELADKLVGSNAILSETYVKNRSLRNFRSRTTPWAECATHAACGFNHLVGLNYSSPCNNSSCLAQLSDVFVRDEQKMVDTLMVADIAHQALAEKATDIVVVSSDTDMWPGVLLALRAGCSITQIHTKVYDRPPPLVLIGSEPPGVNLPFWKNETPSPGFAKPIDSRVIKPAVFDRPAKIPKYMILMSYVKLI